MQLAGFLVNANPDHPAANITFMMDGFNSFEQTIDLESGHAYFAYIRVSRKEKDTTSCDVCLRLGKAGHAMLLSSFPRSQ